MVDRGDEEWMEHALNLVSNLVFFGRSFVYCWITNKLASENNNIPDKNSMVNFGQ